MHNQPGRSPRVMRLMLSAACAALAVAPAAKGQQRLLGVDVSDWQQEDSAGNPLAPIDWNAVHSSGIDFVFHRSTRGGTTGTYNKYTGTGTLSYRYDDYRFVENITNATAAGVYVG